MYPFGKKEHLITRFEVPNPDPLAYKVTERDDVLNVLAFLDDIFPLLNTVTPENQAVLSLTEIRTLSTTKPTLLPEIHPLASQINPILENLWMYLQQHSWATAQSFATEAHIQLHAYAHRKGFFAPYR